MERVLRRFGCFESWRGGGPRAPSYADHLWRFWPRPSSSKTMIPFARHSPLPERAKSQEQMPAVSLCFDSASRPPITTSAVLPVGFAFFYQGAEAFLGVFEAIEFVEEDVEGIFQAFAEGHAHAADNGFFGHGEDRRRMAGDAGDHVFDGGFQLRFGDEAIDEAEFEGALGGDGFAEENKFEGDFGADEKGQNRGGQRGENSDGDFGLREASFGSGDNEIAESGEFGSAADGRAVDDGDDGLCGFEHAGADGMEGFDHLVDAIG